jgi:arylformamidase
MNPTHESNSSGPRLHDVSIAIFPGMPQWAGEQVVTEQAQSRTPHDRANVTQITLTTHTGTHVDPPRHFVHGAPTVDEIPLERWIGPCWVADVTSAAPEIEVADLEAAGIPPGTERLVLKTRSSELWGTHPNEFVDTFVALSVPAAEWIVARGIKLVAIDSLSVGPFHTTGLETHLALLDNDVVAVEGLDLRGIEPGRYELLCMPLKIRNGDGAPARVALRGPLG